MSPLLPAAVRAVRDGNSESATPPCSPLPVPLTAPCSVFFHGLERGAAPTLCIAAALSPPAPAAGPSLDRLLSVLLSPPLPPPPPVAEVGASRHGPTPTLPRASRTGASASGPLVAPRSQKLATAAACDRACDCIHAAPAAATTARGRGGGGGGGCTSLVALPPGLAVGPGAVGGWTEVSQALLISALGGGRAPLSRLDAG